MEARAYVEEGEAIGQGGGDVHRLLAVDRRRLALEVLAERGPTGLDVLAEEIVRREDDGEVTEPTHKQRAIDLYHRHLPLLADFGVVEYDRRSKRVEACRIGAEVAWMERRGARRRCAIAGYVDTDGTGHVDAVVPDDVDTDGRRRCRPDR